MAGRKVFTSGEILTAADVNSFLMNQVVAVFADSTARSSAIPSPSEGMVTYREDANRVEVFDGSSFGPIGGILQVVQTFKTDTFTSSVSTGALVDITGLSASITPSSTSSKVLAFVEVTTGRNSGGDGNAIALTRDATKIGFGVETGSRTGVLAGGASPNAETIVTSSGLFLDSPSSVSALTYQVQIMTNRFDTQTVFVNRSSGDADLDRRFRSTSSVTLMEVAV